MVLCAKFSITEECVSTDAWKIGCHARAGSVSQLIKRKALGSSDPAAFMVFVH